MKKNKRDYIAPRAGVLVPGPLMSDFDLKQGSGEVPSEGNAKEFAEEEDSGTFDLASAKIYNVWEDADSLKSK